MSNKTERKTLLESTETIATVIHAILRKQYGDDVYDWDPLTVAMEVRDDFSAEISSESLDRWSAIQVSLTTDAFFNQLDAFMGICNTLADGEPFFQIFDPVTTEEAEWGITEISLNRELLPFSYPIKYYLKQIIKADGFTPEDAPPAIREALEAKPAALDIRRGLAAQENASNIELYTQDQLRDMVSQFNKMDDLKEVDNIILNRSLDEYVGGLFRA